MNKLLLTLLALSIAGCSKQIEIGTQDVTEIQDLSIVNGELPRNILIAIIKDKATKCEYIVVSRYGYGGASITPRLNTRNPDCGMDDENENEN